MKVKGLDRLDGSNLQGMGDALWNAHTTELRARFAQQQQQPNALSFTNFCAQFDSGLFTTTAMNTHLNLNHTTTTPTTSQPFNPNTITIDVRPPTEYLLSHINNSYNLPLEELQDRSYELPPRTTNFQVVCSRTQINQTKIWFLEKHTKPWPVSLFLIFEKVAVQMAADEHLVRNVPRHYSTNGIPLFPFSPAPILSSELDYLVRVLRLSSASSSTGSQSPSSSPSTKVCSSPTPFASARTNHSAAQHLVLDVGCGAGRDTLTLSYAFPAHNIIALDSLPIAIQRVTSFAQREDRHNIIPFQTKLSQAGDLETAIYHILMANKAAKKQTKDAKTSSSNSSSSSLKKSSSKNQQKNTVQRHEPISKSEILAKTSSSCSLIVISRFHKTCLYEEYIRLLRPGGYIVYHHFLMSCTKPKNPIHKIKRYELTEYFQKNGLEVVKDEVIVGDGNRELSMWMGRKPEDGRSTAMRNKKQRKK